MQEEPAEGIPSSFTDWDENAAAEAALDSAREAQQPNGHAHTPEFSALIADTIARSQEIRREAEAALARSNGATRHDQPSGYPDSTHRHIEANSPVEWPEPVDFWGGSHNLAPWEPEYSPPAIAPYIADQADMRGLDATMQAGCCLWACALLLRRGIELEMQPSSGEGMGWIEKPNLWVAIRGEPGDGKGPAMDAALYRPTKIGDRMYAQDLEAWKQYEDRARIHENALQTYFKAAAKDASAQRPEAPEKPPRRRILADDITKEAVAKLLIENPRGKVGLAKGELASWLGSMGAYGASGAEKDRGDWLEAYESKRRFIDRVKDGGSWDVPSWGVPILGGIQPTTLAKIAARLGDDGMLQRFQIIVSTPKRIKRPRRDDPAATALYNTVCENLAAMEPRGNPVKFSREAAEFFWECQQWLDRARNGAPVDPLKFALNKWEGLLGRLCITSHCIADAAQGLPVPSPEVSLATIEQCWRWVQNILWPHAHYFYTASIETAMGKNLQKFGDYLLARPGLKEIKTGYLTAQWSHYKTFTTMQTIREFWDAAVRNGAVRPHGHATNRAGTLPAVFEVNPKFHDGRFSLRAQVAAAMVARARETMPAQFRREPGED